MARARRRLLALFQYAATSVLLGLFVLSSCAPKPLEYRETIYIFGTLVDIVIRDTDDDTARAAIRAVDQEFQKMHVDWHAWEPGELTRINAALAAGQPIQVSPFLLPVIVQAKALAASSENLFNPAIGALIGAWGFHSDVRPDGVLPDMKAIRHLVAQRPTMSDVHIKDNRVWSSNPAVQFDFGGFAKGTALDRAVDILKTFDIHNAIINAGGDLNIMGSAGERPWRVGIRHPAKDGLIASVELGDNENLYTSGNYFRYREFEGVRYSHIIDPRDGMPVGHIVSASVIHGNGAVADAAATALTVAGPGQWHRIARKMGIKFALLVDDQGTIYTNPAMLKRTTFVGDTPPKIELSPPLERQKSLDWRLF